METKQKYTVIGMMSGTSLDGLDIACCTFLRTGKQWSFKIIAARTVKYQASWTKILANAHTLSGLELINTDVSYGGLLGKIARDFIAKNKLKADFIASHGHTVFHQPERGFTCQIGNGNAIHAATGLPVICDFRSLDVIRGGEGAPLVPVGDKFLFHEYDVCLNVGGIANLSTDIKRARIAFDICFANMALNYLAAKAGQEFDRNGAMASDGEINKPLLKNLDKIYSRLRKKRPSLGREIFESQIKPLLDNEAIPLNDRLATLTESAAKEIVSAVPEHLKTPRVLCTGGGVFNAFLISRILENSGDRLTLILPEVEIIKFKEAIVFGFLGVLRVRDEPNCLRSVTGATEDSSAGILVGF
jgi:anhydro-N-acetylmuramic acid kinase